MKQPDRQLDALRVMLQSLDGAGYRAYRRLKGRYPIAGWDLAVDHVQGDPFAAPTRVRAHLSAGYAELPGWATATADRRRATADFLNRAFAVALGERTSRMGSGRSGELAILRPGQQVLERTSVRVDPAGTVEVRLRAGLPAEGRRIRGHDAARLLCELLPAALAAVLPLDATAERALAVHVEVVEDAVALRQALSARGLIAFVADGALLPRRTGVDDRPLPRDLARAFQSPPGLRVTLQVPNAGAVTGLGIPEGVTLIVGGGYHGKSTLLRALERGVYDHIPGDGRMQVVARTDAVKVRAENGRAIAGTDISSFIGRLPDGSSTSSMISANASGSTSQAAAIAEAIEVGAAVLFLDEDTCATNFMIRDARMQDLVPPANEPITPFIDRVRSLRDEAGVSTVLVIGGSGDYFDVADTVIAMQDYVPYERTAEAKAIVRARPTERRSEAAAWCAPRARVPIPESIDASDRRRVRIRIHERDRLSFGGTDVDLGALEQLVERAQTAAIAQALVGPARPFDGTRTLSEGARALLNRILAEGLDVIDDEPMGEYAEFRIHELAAFLNRLRTFKTQPAQPIARERATMRTRS